MTAAVMGDAAVTTRGQKKHLILKSIRTQRPAVTEDDRLARAPVVVVDPRTILRGVRAHVTASSLIVPLVDGLRQEPCPALGLIDPHFDQARGSHVIVP